MRLVKLEHFPNVVVMLRLLRKPLLGFKIAFWFAGLCVHSQLPLGGKTEANFFPFPKCCIDISCISYSPRLEGRSFIKYLFGLVNVLPP